MDHARQLGEDSIEGLLLRFSVPAIVGMLVHALYNVVDRIFIGRAVGSIGIAAISVAFPMMVVLMAFGMLIGIGANSLISIRLGQQRKAAAERVMGNAVVLFLIVSAVLTGAGLLFLTPVLRLFGAGDAILPQARDYLGIILVGTIFQSFGFGMNNFIRGEGNPKTAMSTMLIGAFLNMVLDPILIFGCGLGLKGAAIATVISQAVSAIWVWAYFLGGRSLLKVRWQALRLEWGTVKGILAVGSAPFAMQLASSLIVTIFNHQLGLHGGTTALSVMGIQFSILMLIMMPVIGIAQGAQPIIGYNYGAGNTERVIRAVRIAAAAATAVTTAGFVAVMVFPGCILALFAPGDPALLAMGKRAMRIFMLLLPVVGFQVVCSHYFQAVGKARQAMLLNLSRQVLLLIPALLVLPGIFGLDGVWLASPFSDLGAALVTGACIVVEIRQLRAADQASRVPAQVAREGEISS